MLKDDAEAEEVVQEAYLRAFTHLETYQGNSRLSTWLTPDTIIGPRSRERESLLEDVSASVTVECAAVDLLAR